MKKHWAEHHQNRHWIWSTLEGAGEKLSLMAQNRISLGKKANRLHQWREINWASIKHESGTAPRHVNCHCDLFECLKALRFLLDKFYICTQIVPVGYDSVFRVSNALEGKEDVENFFTIVFLSRCLVLDVEFGLFFARNLF